MDQGWTKPEFLQKKPSPVGFMNWRLGETGKANRGTGKANQKTREI